MQPYNNQPPYGQPPQNQQGNWLLPNNQGSYNQDFSSQGFTNNQNFPPQNYGYNQNFNQGYSNQGYPNQGYSNQNFPSNTGYNTFNNQQPTYGGTSFQNNNQFGGGGQFGNYSDFDIPDEFTIKEKLLTIGMDMKLLRGDNQFGFIKQKLFSLGRTFQLENSNGTVVAVAKEKILSIGRDFQIFDSSNTKIGSITEQVLKSMLSFHRKYTVRDRYNNVVGTTKQLELFNKSGIQVINNMGSTQAKFSESWSAFIKEEWNVRFTGNTIDRRLLVFFPSVSSQRQEEKNLQN